LTVNDTNSSVISSTISASAVTLSDNFLTTSLGTNGLVVNTGQLSAYSSYAQVQPNGLIVNDATHTVSVSNTTVAVLGIGACAGLLAEMEFDKIRFTNDNTGVDSILSNAELSIADASGNSATMTPASLVLATSTNSLTISPTLSTSVGGSTDQYLVVTINGTAYRISLLAPS
jgi:hypothetical protein